MIRLRYPTFTTVDGTTTCRACHANVPGVGWQPKVKHVDWHVFQLRAIGERVRELGGAR